jgi:cell fate (sporulation/competence/biofilm development) regulator YlbF (YheA/YmcA/DUF963 family)
VNPHDKAHELARAIRESEVFARTLEARKRLEQNPSTVTMVQDFRRRQWELQTKAMMGQSITEEDQATLSKLAEVVSINPDVSQYLSSEYQLSVLLSDIQKILGGLVSEAALPEPISFNEGEDVE